VPRYIVKFTKNVLSDSGHQATIIERAFDLTARDREEAKQLAKRRFCDLEGVGDWSLHADEILVEEADFPS
jgi:hypothetical protein